MVVICVYLYRFKVGINMYANVCCDAMKYDIDDVS